MVRRPFASVRITQRCHSSSRLVSSTVWYHKFRCNRNYSQNIGHTALGLKSTASTLFSAGARSGFPGSSPLPGTTAPAWRQGSPSPAGAQAYRRSPDGSGLLFHRRYAIFCGGCQCNCRGFRPQGSRWRLSLFPPPQDHRPAGVRASLGLYMRP